MTDKDRAVNCDIVAEEVRIVSAEGGTALQEK